MSDYMQLRDAICVSESTLFRNNLKPSEAPFCYIASLVTRLFHVLFSAFRGSHDPEMQRRAFYVPH